nr:ATP-binding cassette domain-containing protein [Cellulomonas sp. JH27-2]
MRPARSRYDGGGSSSPRALAEERGWEAVTTRRLADAIEYSQPVLYGHFPQGRAEIVTAVALAGFEPSSGAVTIGGEVVFGPSTSVAEATRVRLERIGVVFQSPQLLGSLTALEQLELHAHLRGRRPASVRREAMELLDAVGVGPQHAKRPAQLSGGQRQRVAIARAFVGDLQVLLVDEPTSALDHERGTQVVDLITTLARQRGAATLLVSHDASTLATVDATVHMLDARIEGGLQPTAP